jgi:HK97 family phage prohead protease
MVSDIERRYTPVPVQVRADGDKQKIGGYAAVFGKLSRNLGGFVELIAPSFFNTSRTAGWPDVIARYNHDDNMLLGSTGGNTLRLSIDETGLLYDVDPPVSRADIVELIARGDVRKSSFAFRLDVNGDEWTTTDQGFPMRKLVSGQLVDVAPVNIPAYPDTTSGLRSLAAHVHAEVRKMAEADELRKFFVRTDRKTGAPVVPSRPKLFGPSAAAALLSRREDPYV